MSEQKGEDWFNNDPEWAELLRRSDKSINIPKKPKQSTINKNKNNPNTDITTPSQNLGGNFQQQEPKHIKLSIDLKLPKPKLHKIPNIRNIKSKLKNKKIYMPLVALFFIGISVVVYNVKNHKTTLKKDPSGVLANISQKPTFKTVLPNNSKETEPSKLKYDAIKKVAQFTDKISLIDVTVSEQELPETFKSSPDDKVAELAKNINANEVINEANPKAYLGTSLKGPQTVLFHKKGLLIFISSTAAIEKSEWASYITKLQ